MCVCGGATVRVVGGAARVNWPSAARDCPLPRPEGITESGGGGGGGGSGGGGGGGVLEVGAWRVW